MLGSASNTNRPNVDKYDTLEPSKEDRRAFSDIRKRKSAENTTQTTKKGKKNSKEDQKKKEASIRASQGKLMSRVKGEDNKRRRIEVDTSSDDSMIHRSINNRKKQNSTEDSELYKRLAKLITNELKIVSTSIKKTMEKNMDIIALKVTKVEKEIASLRSQLSVISLSLRSSGSAHQSSAIGGLPTTRKIFNSSLDQSEKTYNSTPLLSDSLMDIVKMDIEIMDTSTADFQPDILSTSQITTLQTVDPVSESPHVQVNQSVISIAMTPHEVSVSNVNSEHEPMGHAVKTEIEIPSIDETTVDFEPRQCSLPTDCPNKSSVQDTEIVQNGINSTVDLEPIKSIPLANRQNKSKDEKAIASSTPDEQTDKVPGVENVQTELNNSKGVIFENFGGVRISQNKLSLCDRHGKLSKFVNDVMLLIFSRQEMADSSISGKRANVHVHRDVNEVRKKKQLDTVKVKALIEYIKKEMPGSEDKKILEAIRSKLKYEGTRIHGVGFRKFDAKNTETIDRSN